VTGRISILIFRWQERQKAIEVSPLTETTPGFGYAVEHSAHVGMKELIERSDGGIFSSEGGYHLGSMSTMVHPSRSKYPARIELV
jgi:hypothetical protein